MLSAGYVETDRGEGNGPEKKNRADGARFRRSTQNLIDELESIANEK